MTALADASPDLLVGALDAASADTLTGYQLTVGVTHLGDAVEAGEYNVGASFGALSAVGPDVL